MLPFVSEGLDAFAKMFARRGFRLWLVGGCVRDWMVGADPKDIDLCTDATPEEQVALYDDLGLAHYPTGIAHGTVSVMVADTLYEITTLRTESDHDGRHATVAFTRDLMDDLARRDLTINAMAMTMSGELIDPFGGARDLEDKRVRFVGEPSERIGEDHLRILRFVRFHGRYGGGMMDPAATAACALYSSDLRKISGERIWAEMQKIVAHDSGPRMVRQMARLGLFEALDVRGALLHDQFELAHRYTRNPVTLMAVLVGDLQPVAARWRWSNAEKALGEFLRRQLVHAAPSLSQVKFQCACNGVSKAHAEQWLLAMGQSETLTALRPWEAPPLPINGDDLLARGFRGKEIGAALSAARLTWALGDYRTTRDDMLAMVERAQEAPGG